MTAELLHVAPEPHRCQPPHGRDDGWGWNSLLPAGPPGSVWRCPACGRLHVAMAGGWDDAGWLTRWRYRKAGR